MKRRDLLSAAGIGIAGSIIPALSPIPALAQDAAPDYPLMGKPLKPPANGPVQVAFVIAPHTVLIDLAGPWEAFYDSMSGFHLYTVAPSMDMVTMGGLKVLPDYTFENAPKPNVVVVPQSKELPETIAYIKDAAKDADVTMSICTGALLVAKAGLFDGLHATTHHNAYDALAQFPKVKLVRGPRFVEEANVSSSGGETSGIDLALRVVERYYGKSAARSAISTLEFVSAKRALPWTK
ncbi:MAG TPA: DJ-1/PfpI family protein [Candidatus Rubrimentiphilum sp.]|nr:DJ-1/PfpI family protein [Candidatus Rubrimentiphilum sp.]